MERSDVGQTHGADGEDAQNGKFVDRWGKGWWGRSGEVVWGRRVGDGGGTVVDRCFVQPQQCHENGIDKELNKSHKPANARQVGGGFLFGFGHEGFLEDHVNHVAKENATGRKKELKGVGVMAKVETEYFDGGGSGGGGWCWGEGRASGVGLFSSHCGGWWCHRLCRFVSTKFG